ncbi:glycosyltransferase [Herbaspirillum frisingense]|uniref:CgeB family protein n=1 Tax=Herbaspirillum frisingense TaxID=92645 RepID=UPI0039B128DA
MVGRVIRAVGSLIYRFPELQEDQPAAGPFGQLKIALVTDHFTADCLSGECRVRALTPANYRSVIGEWKPDLVFVESAFHGIRGSWRYELARQPRLLRLTRPTAIFRLIDFAKARGIPTVFWNKDDGAYFEPFIDVARHFDYIFTTDETCVPRYRAAAPGARAVNTLIMPYQPAFHRFDGFRFTHKEACFTGSYYRRILGARREFLDSAFQACADTALTLNVFDRNHDRLSRYIEFRYPRGSHLNVQRGVAHRQTAEIYKRHVLSLNVNSVTASDTMFSRRLLEILACGGIAVTNPSRSVERHFADFCHVVRNREEMQEVFGRLKHGPSSLDLERAEAGARYVRAHHTWSHRLQEVCAVLGL